MKLSRIYKLLWLACQKKSYLTCVKVRNSELLRNIFKLSLSYVVRLSFVTLKKNRNRFREYSQIRHFDTYQTVFLLTCQTHKKE